MSENNCPYCNWAEGHGCESRSEVVLVDRGSGLRYWCSREAGHPGDHIACGIDLHVVARWPNEKEGKA